MDLISMMRVFVTVADKGSMASAGRDLNLSPSVMSKNLSALEIANTKHYHDAKAFELQDHIIFICILRMKLLNLTMAMVQTILAHRQFPALTIMENGVPQTKYVVGVGKPADVANST